MSIRDKQGRSGPLLVFTREVPGTPDTAGFDVIEGPEDRLGGAALFEHISGAEAVVTMFSDRVDRAFLDAAGPQLRVVANFAVGFDNIDIEACKERGVVVTNTPDAVTEGTADMAWALILAVARRVVEGDRFCRSGDWAAGGPLGMSDFMGVDLTGRTLHIVGAGRIGAAVAKRSIGWGMRVLYTARSRKWDFELAPLAAERVDLDDGLARADVVSVHPPLTTETRHLIDAPALSRMKREAIIVNTARGPVIDEAALVEVLADRRIFGAGLDVFEREPEIHPGLVGLDNVVMTPHVGSAERRYREMMTQMVCDNVRAVLLENREPPNRIA
ncbi:MAG: D-glycerate dehydrogenase [Planctomycetota bacterium]